VFTPEKDIRSFIKKNENLPVIESVCPENKHTERETIKQLLNSLEHDYKGLKHRIFGALQKDHIDGY
jgi:tRNA(Ile)-lysidine synthase TilS/MesJ